MGKSQKDKRKEKKKGDKTRRDAVVDLDSTGTPYSLLGGGEHFTDCPQHEPDESITNHPMDGMIELVRVNELTRPTVK